MAVKGLGIKPLRWALGSAAGWVAGQALVLLADRHAAIDLRGGPWEYWTTLVAVGITGFGAGLGQYFAGRKALSPAWSLFSAAGFIAGYAVFLPVFGQLLPRAHTPSGQLGWMLFHTYYWSMPGPLIGSLTGLGLTFSLSRSLQSLREPTQL